MNKISLSIIVLVGNESDLVIDCLKSCNFAGELILVAANSTKPIISLAKKTIKNIKIIETQDEYNKNFSKWRNLGLNQATGSWVLYVDVDERITRDLQQEILHTIKVDDGLTGCYVVPRANYFLGKRVKYGGTYPDYVKRLFNHSLFKGFAGELHEEPVFLGQLNYLKSDLLHYTHRDLKSMLEKTNVWTDMEARLLLRNHHPPVTWWRFFRMVLTKFTQRYIILQMYRDGTIGLISSIFESFDTFIIYAKLWELQLHEA